MIKLIAIIGEAGTGKDSLARNLVKESPELFSEIINCTTRPKREYEIDGVDYHFIASKKNFEEYISNGEMLEYSIFNDWYYGTSLLSLSSTKINVGVFNPEGIRNIYRNNNDISFQTYKLEVNPKERLLRQLLREQNPDVEEIVRRYATDKNDFSRIDFPYIPLKNNTREEMKNNIALIKKRSLASQDKLD